MKQLYTLIFILLLVIPYSSFSKKKPDGDIWNPGVLVLKNNETVKGDIYYNSEYDLVQIKLDDQIKTYSAYHVQYFQFYDEIREINRLYATMETFATKKKRKGVAFYEVLIDGEMVLLRKEDIHYFQDYEILYNAIDLVPSLASKHYVFFKENLINFKNFRKEILPLMADKAEDIEKYIKDNNFNTQDLVGQILIIDYYNFLKDPLYKLLDNQILVKE